MPRRKLSDPPFDCTGKVRELWRRRVAARKWRDSNLEKARHATKVWNMEHKAYGIEYKRDWRKRNPVQAREYQVRHRYGLTPEQYSKLIEEQDNKCAICHQPPVKKRLHVDHDFVTGKVRGLLCSNCNVAIGLLQHDIKKMEDAITYLKEHVCS